MTSSRPSTQPSAAPAIKTVPASARSSLPSTPRLIPIRIAPDGAATPRILTVDDWVNLVAKRGSAVFYERQVKVGIETWDHMAHLWSTYETRTTPDGKPPEGKLMDRGINSIQARLPTGNTASGT